MKTNSVTIGTPNESNPAERAIVGPAPSPSKLPWLCRVTSKPRDGSHSLEWIAINRTKPPVDYASALPANLVDSAAARSCIDRLFTDEEAEALLWHLYGPDNSMVEAIGVHLPLSKEAVEQMCSPEDKGDPRFIRHVSMKARK